MFRFLDLGAMPLANSFLTEENLESLDEPTYPLDVFFCNKCGLVQIGDIVPPENLFTEYIYFSSTSELVHQHADYLARSFKDRFDLNEGTRLVEIASNDGTVLHYFKKLGIQVLGIEPALNVAKAALDSGIETISEFFNYETSKLVEKRFGKADIILARHVFAHVPDIHNFLSGLVNLLSKKGVVAIEVPYLVDLIENNEFDTIYHEHCSYLSLRTLSSLFNLYDMEVFDVEKVNIHGGSIIFFIGRNGEHSISKNVDELKQFELEKKMDSRVTYINFAKRVNNIKISLMSLLKELKDTNKRIVAYGAPAKGNTLLNFCKISTDIIDYTVDKSPHKQNLFTPGMHIPIYHPDKIYKDIPDYVLLLSWNFAEEIFRQQKKYRDQGGKFILPVPEVRIL